MKNNWLLFFLFIFLPGCKKHPDHHYYLTDDAKKYTAFQKGNYWIYQNDSTLITDSMYVDSTAHGIADQYNYDLDYTDYFEDMGCFIKTVTDSNYRINFVMSAYTEVKTIIGCEFYHSFAVGVKLDESGGGEQLSPRLNPACLVGPFGGFVVNGSTYTNVYDIKTDESSAYDSSISRADVFIVKNIGILKWNVVYNDSSKVSYSLLRSHIVF